LLALLRNNDGQMQPNNARIDLEDFGVVARGATMAGLQAEVQAEPG
jgi:hypothetical protein